MVSISLPYELHGIVHTKFGSCNPKAEAQDLQPLVYIWSQNLSLHRNKIISASHSDMLLFCK